MNPLIPSSLPQAPAPFAPPRPLPAARSFPGKRRRSLCLPLLLLWAVPVQAGTAAELPEVSVSLTPAVPAEEAVDFNRDIRPILSENCFYCHGQDPAHRKGDLRLDQREGAVAAGALVPGNPVTSELMRRLLSSDPDEVMPPPDSHRQVTAEQREKLRRWIRQGAAYAPHWTFIPPVRPLLPAVRHHAWPRNQIDHFILHGLESAGLKPAPEADRATLLRRVSYDLTGLPPTPREVDEFLADSSPVAYEKAVERLLASPHYGERMALPWLDAARYADSNGFQQDGDTFQWIWRDWVVRMLNADQPFDQFATEQLAGDLLPNPTQDQKIATGFNRNHLLNGEGGAIAEEQRNVVLFDRVDVTSTVFLGLTVACAQCHDHKYDPITQKDYYSLMAGFNNLPESGVPSYYSTRIRVAPPLLELVTEEYQNGMKPWLEREAAAIAAAGPDWEARRAAAQKQWEDTLLASDKPEDADWKKAVQTVRAAPADKPDTKAAGQLRKEFDEKRLPGMPELAPVKAVLDARRDLNTWRHEELPRVMIMADTQPRETRILSRGDYLQPMEKVSFATPAFLPPLPAGAPPNRLGLARWLFDPGHPLTARVQVNRYWQHFFGMGLVKTSEDLGVQGEYPPHRPLLDWLAVEFRESGWRVKALHRLIVTSATYRQSSRFTEAARQMDPENRLLSRGPRFRLPAMLLRDTALAASGLLDLRIGGRPVYPYQPDGIWETLAITKERDFTYPLSSGRDLHRRSLYTFHRRTVAPANMFDASARQSCKVRPDLTNTPLHALTTLNDPTWVEAARVLAARLLREIPDLPPSSAPAASSSPAIVPVSTAGTAPPADPAIAGAADRAVTETRLIRAFRLITVRTPGPEDLTRLRGMLDRQRAHFTPRPEEAAQLVKTGVSPVPDLPAVEHAAWTAVCLGIMNLDEALTRE